MTSFQLRSVDWKITRELEQEQQDVDFDYEEEYYLSDYDADSDSSDVQFVKNYGVSLSLCYTKMRSFRLFCGPYKDVFLTYLVNKLHIMLNDIFSL